jgi:hypothetical protein
MTWVKVTAAAAIIECINTTVFLYQLIVFIPRSIPLATHVVWKRFTAFSVVALGTGEGGGVNVELLLLAHLARLYVNITRHYNHQPLNCSPTCTLR